MIRAPQWYTGNSLMPPCSVTPSILPTAALKGNGLIPYAAITAL
jgi:hypothetical protein